MNRVTDIPRPPQRRADAHKGDFGRVCIVAGSVGMSGAAALAGRAALRAGSGLVRVATARSAQPVVAALEPCYTTISLPEDEAGRIVLAAIDAVLGAVEANDAVAIGPGLGVSGDLRKVVEILIARADLPLVIDGDGLNNLAALGDWPGRAKARIILTPHPGEMKRLWRGLIREDMPADRQATAVQFAERTGAVVALKGAETVVADAERLYVNQTGNPGMATAGSGDVLTGVIVSLLGQGLPAFDAVVLGVHIHGFAGDIAAGRIGQISLIATDILEALCDAFRQLQDPDEAV
ncbi:MAG TPA: NAD(P)H-hydrate dehydratase [Phycisphaerales bacterium]|nr:NAD(P)H-hydrate dehydratase [Phycisphaerales bacterium]